MVTVTKTKQEAIREGTIAWLDDRFGEGHTFNYQLMWDYLEYLHSQGVVRKVDGGLPEVAPVARGSAIENITQKAQQDMLEAGYTAWEPLIVSEASR